MANRISRGVTGRVRILITIRIKRENDEVEFGRIADLAALIERLRQR